MRLATVLHEGVRRAAVVTGDGPGAWRAHLFTPGTSTLDLIRSGLTVALDAGRAAVGHGRAVELDEVQLLAPVTPPTLRDFVAFEEHVEGMRAGVGSSPPPAWYTAPAFSFGNPYGVVGTGHDVAAPPGSRRFDFGLEVAAVIGASGHDLDPADAHAAVFGYCVMNDWSARDLLCRESAVGLGPAKGADAATTLGPWIVTADEFTDRHDADGFLHLAMSVRVNDVEIGHDLLSNVGWPFAELVAYASVGTWVHPGDVLGSGAAGNGGCLAELWARSGRVDPPPLRPGDVVEMTVEGIGTIRNTVVAGRPAPVTAPARVRARDRA